MVDSELYKQDDVLVDDLVFPVRPAAHAGSATALIRVLASSEQLVLSVLHGVDVPVGELGALVIEALSVGDDLLEGRRVDLVRHGLAINWVPHVDVLDLEGAVCVEV